ncbi:MAG: CocE/NonD family hydrolase [Edaphobacter sp.]
MRVRRWFAVMLCGFVLASGSAAWAKQESVKPAATLLTAAALDEYVGQYREPSEPDVVDSVYREGDSLYIESERMARVELRAESTDHFFAPGSLLRMDFLRDAGEKIIGVKMMYGPTTEWSLDRFSDVGMRLNHALAYSRTVVMMPMRDGVKLHAVILRPVGSEDSGKPLPFLMERTPYGTDDTSSESVNSSKPELAASGYIFVFSDIRGRYESGGRFVMNRPIVAHRTKNDVDETTDTRDTIDWLLKNVANNNGRVGVMGVSYPGFLAMMAGIDAHPAVKAISPQAPMTDVWLGDDFFHNGAFRETYGFDYVQELEKQKTTERVDTKGDTYDFFLQHVNFAGAAKAAHIAKLPTAKAFLTQPAYTSFWQKMAVQPHLTKVEVPTLEVGGWWDQEDMWGTQAEYAALEPHDAKHEVFLVLGPWNHGGWELTTRHLGPLDFGAATGDQYRKTVEAPFFEKYLKDKAGFDLRDTDSFRTGVDKWELYDSWPPKVGFRTAKMYLNTGGGLSFAAPVGGGVAAAYVSDPASPIPYRHRPIQATYGEGSKWRTWLVEDQRFVSNRKDLVNFSAPVLDHDVTVTGDVLADLFASTTGSDADWVVKLIDVYPKDAAGDMAGYQLMIADEIFRGRYLKGFEKPEPLVPGQVTEFKWNLHGVDHTFLKGHRIMVEVQSSWFPLYDRNPQTFVPNIMKASKKSYKAETETIYGSDKYPSHLEFSIAE